MRIIGGCMKGEPTYMVVREGLTEELLFNQIPEEWEGAV